MAHLFSILVALAAMLSFSFVKAQATEVITSARAVSGKPQAVMSFYNCGLRSNVVGAEFEAWAYSPKNGKSTVRKFNAPRCGFQSVPHVAVIYQSNTGFKGVDEFWVITSGGARTMVRVYVQ